MSKFYSAPKNLVLSAFLAGSFVLGGCSNVGNAPEGPTAGQVQADFAKQDPQQQIKGIQFSPLPPAEKERRIQEVEAKYGVKRGDPTTPISNGGAGAGQPQ